MKSNDQQQCLHRWFEAQVERTPDAVAVVFPKFDAQGRGGRYEREQLTYRALNRRANQLAHHLQALGVGPEVLVGVCLERSLEMVIGLLAILKAGGAYVPLDQAYPKERLAFVLDDTQTPVLVTDSGLLTELPEQAEHGCQVVCLDTDGAAIARQSSENPTSAATADNLAYAIYTSGSTGKPKGVLISHRNVARLFTATHPWFHFDEEDVWTLFHSYAFDFSVWELWGALLYGGRLVVVPYWTSRSPEAFSDLLRREQVTVLNQTPSAFRQLIRAAEALGAATDLALRLVIFGGEALEFHSLRPWFERHGDQTPQLVNMYGITETTVHVTYRPVTMADLNGASGSLIGEPIPDLQVHLLDPQMQPVPVGVSGELYVGGPGVGRGYLNRPELTAERFVPDPFASAQDGLSGVEPQPRLYRSGDLARRLPNGELEYLGRIDHQVKMRGFRIELGEIETVLNQHPAVRESVVLALDRQNGSDEKYLAAYIVSGPKEAPAVSELRRFLQEKLPDYMVPAAFVSMEALPLTPNGKIDRRALPSPGTGRPELDAIYVAPRTDLERFLAEVWRETLGVDKIGVRDSFFELGGDSLKGAIVVNKLQAALETYVYIVALFEAPTVAALADYLVDHYPEAVAKLLGVASSPDKVVQSQRAKIDRAKAAQARQWIRSLPPRPESGATAAKNPPAIFILTPPRSGSTLLRVMLAGHPRLFAPPELDLLSFNTLQERKAALSGGHSFRLEGTIRAIMALKGCDAEQARQMMAAYEDQQMTTQQFYRLLQVWIAPRTLVDKSTFYTLDLETLKRAEIDFDHARYIHLLRHPYGMLHSFEEARADRIYFKDQPTFSAREVGELTWLICHQNILEFLRSVPAQRQHRLKFEDLVNRPKAMMEGICQFLNLPLDAAMLQPYRDQDQRMTDGIHPARISRMLGDVKFHEHSEIDPRVAERWQEYYTADFLGDETWQVAEALGYERRQPLNQSEYGRPQAPGTGLKPIQRVSRTALRAENAGQLRARLDQLSDEEVDALLKQAYGTEGLKK